MNSTRSLRGYRAELADVPNALQHLCDSLAADQASVLREESARLQQSAFLEFYGMASSQWASWPTVCRLRCDRLGVGWGTSFDGLAAFPSTVPESTSAVIVSQSGHTIESLKLIDQLRTQHPTIHRLVITNDSSSPIATAANSVIDISAGEERHAPTKTYVNSVATLLVIGAETRGQGRLMLDGLRSIIPVFADYLNRSEKWAAEAAATYDLTRLPQLCFLAQGAQLSSAWQSSMLVSETLGLSACTHDWATFRHGFEPQVNERFWGIGFEPQFPVVPVWRTAVAGILDRHGKLLLAPRMNIEWPSALRDLSQSAAAIWETIPIHFLCVYLGRKLNRDPSQIERKMTLDL